MKINRNNKFIAAGIAAIAVAGLTIGTSACSSNGENGVTEVLAEIADSTNDSSNTDDSSANDALDTNAGTTSVSRLDDANPASGEVSGAASESAHSDEISTDAVSAGADTSATEAEAVEDPTVEDPTVEDPTVDSAPEISTGTGSRPFGDVTAMPGAMVEQVLFVGSNGNVDANIFAKESGFGGNDIVAVKLVYYVGAVKTSSSASLGITASTTRSLWNAEGLNLTEGMSVSVRLTDENGRTTYHDVIVEFTPPM